MSKAAIMVTIGTQENLLDSRLSSDTTSPALRRSITDSIFRIKHSDSPSRNAGNLESYFCDWYEDQCGTAARHVSVKTHREILEIITLLQDASSTKNDIVGLIRQSDSTSSEAHLNASIELAARLWLTISIGSLQQSLAPGNDIAWEDRPLLSVVEQTLCPTKVLDDQIRFPKIFNAANLERIAGIKITWTSNLADHLSVTHDDTRLNIYHQFSFLELHRQGNNSILPNDLIDETTRTLALLIPSTDKACQTWFRRKQKSLRLDSKTASYGPLDASSRHTQHFHHWRDRLIVLKQVFDDSEPNTIISWWYDDRKKVQWYTFWVAALVLLLTIVFGLTQSVAGVVQAWAAVKSIPHSSNNA